MTAEPRRIAASDELHDRVRQAAAQVGQALRDEFVQVLRRVGEMGWSDGLTARASLVAPAGVNAVHGLGDELLLVADPALDWVDLQAYELSSLPAAVAATGWPDSFDELRALHRSRHDAVCVLEVQPPAAMTVALLDHGFEPRLCRDGLRFMDHRHAVVPAELAVQADAWIARTVDALVAGARVVFLAGRSVVVVAESPAVAWADLSRLERACALQLRLLSAGGTIAAVTRPVAATVADQFDRGIIGGPGRLPGGLHLDVDA